MIRGVFLLFGLCAALGCGGGGQDTPPPDDGHDRGSSTSMDTAPPPPRSSCSGCYGGEEEGSCYRDLPEGGQETCDPVCCVPA